MKEDIEKANDAYYKEWQTVFDSTTDKETHQISEDWKGKIVTTFNKTMDLIQQRINNPSKMDQDTPNVTEPTNVEKSIPIQGVPSASIPIHSVPSASIPIQGAPSTSIPVQGDQNTNMGTSTPEQGAPRTSTPIHSPMLDSSSINNSTLNTAMIHEARMQNSTSINN